MAQIPRVNSEVDVRTRALVRTLYLVQGLRPMDIERMGIGVTAGFVSGLAHREGWTKQKKEAASLAEETAIARMKQSVETLTEAIAIESEELCFKALDVTRDGLTKGGLEGAKQAQAASSTLKNLANVAQAIRQPQSNALNDSSRAPNMFFSGGLTLNLAPADPKRAEQVTEVEQIPKSSA